MRTSGCSKSGLFLMELIFLVPLFAISAAICLQMFAYASLTAQKAENLSYATLAARSAAECYQATGGQLVEVADVLSGTATQTTMTVAYDDQWLPVAGDGVYGLELVQRGLFADVAVYAVGEEEPIYT